MSSESACAETSSGATGGGYRYLASDFASSWTNVPDGAAAEGETHMRHILDKELVAICFNLAGVTLSEQEMTAVKKVVNDGDINMHEYKSKAANVGNSEKYAEQNDCNVRSVSDKSAVAKVKESFEDGKVVELTSHENGHIDAQTDVLLHPALEEAMSPDNYEKLLAAYLLLTNKVKGPKDSKTYTDGKAVDGRRFNKVLSPKVKQQVKESAQKYLENKLTATTSTRTKAEASANTLTAEAQRMKESNDAKYTAVVPYSSPSSSSSGHASHRGSGSNNHGSSYDVNDLMRALHSMSMSSSHSHSHHDSSYSYPRSHHYTPSSSYRDSSSVHVGPSTCTRSGSTWDDFRTNVWVQGSGTRAEMSAAYRAHKSGF